MNIKIARTMLILCIVYIAAFYVLKFVFPEYLLLAITDANVLKLGAFIENHVAVQHVYYAITTFTTYYLFVSASKGSFKLKWLDFLWIMISLVITSFVTHYAPEFLVHTSVSLMFLMALLCKGKFAYTVIAFVIHGFLQQFLFSIRGFETIILDINIASGFILTIECYVWLIILGLIFYLKEKKKNGKNMSTIPQQND